MPPRKIIKEKYRSSLYKKCSGKSYNYNVCLLNLRKDNMKKSPLVIMVTHLKEKMKKTLLIKKFSVIKSNATTIDISIGEENNLEVKIDLPDFERSINPDEFNEC